jgi:hypothetical protein
VAASIRKKLAITSPTSGGRSVGIVRSRTQTMEFSFLVSFFLLLFEAYLFRTSSIVREFFAGLYDQLFHIKIITFAQIIK